MAGTISRKFIYLAVILTMIPMVTAFLTLLADSPSGDIRGTILDPVATATGRMYESPEDIFLRSPLPIVFSRYYQSDIRALGDVTSALGNNWMHSFDLHMVLTNDTAKIVFLHGGTVSFSLVGDQWQLQLPSAYGYQLVRNQNLFQFLDVSTSLIYTFNADKAGRLESITDRNGNTVTLTYPLGSTLVNRIEDGTGNRLDFTYDVNNLLVRVQDQTGRNVNFGYAGTNFLSVSDLGSNATVYNSTATVDQVGLLASRVEPKTNAPTHQTYDDAARVSTQTFSGGGTLSLAYNTPTSGQTTVTDPFQAKSLYKYSSGNLTEQVDEAGHSMFLSYDTNNKLTSVKDRAGNTTIYTYHSPSGLLQSITRPDGGKWTATYTATTVSSLTFYDLSVLSFPDGTSELFVYDGNGNVLSRTDRATEAWQFTRNAAGQMLTATLPNGGVITFTYNGDGTLASMQMPGSGATTFIYDAYRRPVRKTYADGSQVNFTYDARDNLISVKNEMGVSVSTQYDTNGLPAGRIDALGAATNFGYSATDQLTKVIDALGNTLTLGLDPLTRINTLIQPDGITDKISYDAVGNPVNLIDGALVIWKAEFDLNGRLAALVTPLNERTELLRDNLGRVTAATTPLGNRWQLGYDSMSRVTSILDPLNATTQISYDGRGQLSSIRMPENVSASYTRDEVGRITQVTDPRGNPWHFAYDGVGRISSASDPLGRTTSYTRDARGKILKVILPQGNVQILRDAVGRVLMRAYSDGTVLRYVYDAGGKLVQGNSIDFKYAADGGLSYSNGISVDRTAAGRIKTITLAPGKTVTYIYDNRGLLLSISDWLGGTTQFTYDKAWRVLSVIRPNNVKESFTYDADGNLSSFSEIGAKLQASATLVRDKRGQLTGASRSGVLIPTSDQLVSSAATYNFDAAFQITGFAYDSLGRRTQDLSRTYSWDLASHLKSFTEAGKTIQCDYDTLGVLISLTADAGTQQYVWNHATPLPTVGVIRQGGVDQRYFVHTPTGELLYSIDAATGARSFYHFDEQGNTVLLTNDAGDVTDRYAYSPDGSLVAVSGATPNPFTFAGRYGVVRLGSANLYAMGTRIYDSATASFLSKDPVFHLDPRQINPYQYAIGNPLAYLNVSGEGLLSITGNETTDILAGGRRNPGIGGFRVGRNENLFETYDEMVSQEEILSYQTIDREYQDLNRLRLLNKSNSVGNLWKNTDLLGQGVVQLRAALTDSHLFLGDRQAVEESLDGSRPVLNFYSAASRDAQKLYKDKIITDLQRRFLVFQIRHTLDDILFLPQGSDETSLLFDLNLYPKTSLLPFILEGQK